MNSSIHGLLYESTVPDAVTVVVEKIVDGNKVCETYPYFSSMIEASHWFYETYPSGELEVCIPVERKVAWALKDESPIIFRGIVVLSIGICFWMLYSMFK